MAIGRSTHGNDDNYGNDSNSPVLEAISCRAQRSLCLLHRMLQLTHLLLNDDEYDRDYADDHGDYDDFLGDYDDILGDYDNILDDHDDIRSDYNDNDIGNCLLHRMLQLAHLLLLFRSLNSLLMIIVKNHE